MSRKADKIAGTMLSLWRPPRHAGVPIGCLTSTFTFNPRFFDEECLARFLDVDSEPNREELAFLLERETRLGTVYAGVVVDHTQAGVEHSLRWDVLPVRIPRGKQHSKMSILAWTDHVRIVITSANLTECGYRFNHEVAGAIELTPDDASVDVLTSCAGFFESLLGFVPGASAEVHEIRRAIQFLQRVRQLVSEWQQPSRRQSVRQQPVFSLPHLASNAATGASGVEATSALEECVRYFRSRGGSPEEAWVASPFFDCTAGEEAPDEVTARLCKAMARGSNRQLVFCLPAVGEGSEIPPRLAAPISLLKTARRYVDSTLVEILPARDENLNPRPWHAKMLRLASSQCTGLMVGSSNFTRAGMGIGLANAEANLLYLADRLDFARAPGLLDSLWPEMTSLEDPDEAEWKGAAEAKEEEETVPAVALPAGFLAASYRAGDDRAVILRLDKAKLPSAWEIHACGRHRRLLLDQAATAGDGTMTETVRWEPVEPPEKLLVRWEGKEGFWPLNVVDPTRLPPPEKLEKMSADDMLRILAASDPGGAIRAWAKDHGSASDGYEDELDSSAPPDLDPLRRYDLHETFLKRVVRRAKILARVRENLQRPAWGVQALEWRLYGLIGIETLADRMLRQFHEADGRAHEALLTLADLLIVLDQVEYNGQEGALSTSQFKDIYRPFLAKLAGRLDQAVRGGRHDIDKDLLEFWGRVVKRCR